MFRKSGFKAEPVSVAAFLRNCLMLNAHAEEGSEPSSENGGLANPSPQINYETLIAKARQEEKDKLYPRIKNLEDENKKLVDSHNKTLIELAQAQTRLKELEDKGESEEVKTLKTQLASTQAELQKVKESTPKEEDIRKKVEAEYEIKLLRQKRVAEVSNDILPVFVDEIQGSTKEEIEASIEAAKKKTIDIKKQLGLLDENGNPIEVKKDEKKKNTGSQKPPASNPSSAGSEKFDYDYIRNLDPRSPEYAEFRKKMGLR